MTNAPAPSPKLLVVAHGTADPDGLAVHHQLTELLRVRRPELDVALCWLDVESPSLPDALSACSGPVVVVPVLLSTGYHVKIDIPAAVRTRQDTVQARHLGPDPRVAQVVFQRLVQAGGGPGRPVSLIGSGSSDPGARDELQMAAAELAKLTGARVDIAQLNEDHPLAHTSPEADVASYLLAPGYFSRRLATSAAPRRVSAPIGSHPLIAEIVIEAYEEAARLLNRA